VLKEVVALEDREQVFAEVVESFNSIPYDDFADRCYDFLRGDSADEEDSSLEDHLEDGHENLEEQLENSRSLAVETGLHFDEEATRSLLLTQG
jgi:hypothetical protein